MNKTKDKPRKRNCKCDELYDCSIIETYDWGDFRYSKFKCPNCGAVHLVGLRVR